LVFVVMKDFTVFGRGADLRGRSKSNKAACESMDMDVWLPGIVKLDGGTSR
jgi:hypothetical protein